jgi:WD40 repeat protein
VPTSLSCSHGGNLLAVAFTDENIRIIDFRVGPSLTKDIGNATMILEGEHSDIIKKVKLSPDGVLLLSAG